MASATVLLEIRHDKGSPSALSVHRSTTPRIVVEAQRLDEAMATTIALDNRFDERYVRPKKTAI